MTPTASFEQVQVGDALPPLEIPITRTLIVAAAIASRDYQDVHHDPELARRKGSKDVFMNILTTNGLVGRFVTDWAGSGAVLRKVRIRLGVPNYPGDTMRLTGTVTGTRRERGWGVVEVAVRGANALGDHVTGSVELSLPNPGSEGAEGVAKPGVASAASPAGAPQPIGSPRTVLEEVLARLQREPVRTVLDVPTGRGALVPRLRQLGYEVAAADIRPDLFEVPETTCDFVDLNRGLPYEAGRFDAVLCCNGIHRVYAVGFSVAEMARVLRRGGRLLVSFPNFSSLSRRTRFFLSGSFSPSFVRSAEDPDRSGGSVRLPVTPAQVLAAVEAAGLRVEGMCGIRRSPGKRRPLRWLYLPLVVPIRLATLLSSRRRRRALRLDPVSTLPLLVNDFVLIEARKEAPAAG